MAVPEDSPTNPFPNFTELKPKVPLWAWDIARTVSVLTALAAIGLLIVKPSLGLAVVWKLAIPVLPLTLAIAPGLWRNVCPLVTLNQLPRRFGFSRSLTLRNFWKIAAVLVAMALFFVFVTLRHPLFNHSGTAVALLLGGALLAAFIGGFIFKGRSGWCGTFCPMSPLERVYGQAPLVLVRNAFCEPCVGCQRNCFDFNARAAVFADLNDPDKWYADHRRLFVAALPGLIFAFFTAPSPAMAGLATYLWHMASVPLLSVGIFYLANSYLRLSAARLTALFGMGALLIFYWYVVPVFLSGLHDVFGFSAPNWVRPIAQGGIGVIGFTVIIKAYLSERSYLKSASEASHAYVAGGAGALRERIAETKSGAQITEQQSGRTFALNGDQTLLDAIEAANLPIQFGCRMGACGADPIAVLSGNEHLSPPGNDELETLRRLGLEGKARLACSCRASGPVTIDLKIENAKEIASPDTDAAVAQRRPGKHVVIIGNGIAGTTTAEQLRQEDPDCQVDIITRESHHFYNRMGLGRVIYGKTAMDDLYLLPKGWPQDHGFSVFLNTLVTGINRDTQTVRLGTGEDVKYDYLVLATGATAFVPPFEGGNLPGCFVLREANDALAIRAFAQLHDCKSAVVLGGGVLGVEGADALRQLGLATTIVHLGDRLMERQLDGTAASILSRYLEGVGIDLRLNTSIDRILGADRVKEVLLKNEDVVPCDIVLICAGIRANLALGEVAELEVDRGIIVNEHLQTSDPHIFAVGDVAQQEGVIGGLWPVALSQARVAASAILGRPNEIILGRDMVQLKVKGIDVKSFGFVGAPSDEMTEICNLSSDDTVWRRLVLKDGKILGGTFVNDASAARNALTAMIDGLDVRAMADDLQNGDWDCLKSGGGR